MRLPVRAVASVDLDGFPPTIVVDADGVTIADCEIVGVPDHECAQNARSIVEALNAAGDTAWIRHTRPAPAEYDRGEPL